MSNGASTPGTTPECDEDCMACSGEICMTHDGPCECDTAERHEDSHGAVYVGGWSGMLRVMEKSR